MAKNVIKIERAKCVYLQGLIRVGNTVRLTNDVEWQLINARYPAKLTISSKKESKNTIYNMVLTFLSCNVLDDCDKFAYRLTLADGRLLLIGSNRRPFPIAQLSETLPDNFSDNQLPEYTVSYSSTKPIPTLLT